MFEEILGKNTSAPLVTNPVINTDTNPVTNTDIP